MKNLIDNYSLSIAVSFVILNVLIGSVLLTTGHGIFGMMFIATGAINVVGMVTGAVALIFLGEGVDPATIVELT
jgi:hypothetical protein